LREIKVILITDISGKTRMPEESDTLSKEEIAYSVCEIIKNEIKMTL